MISTKIKMLVLNPAEPMNGVTWWRMYQPFAQLARTHGDMLEIHYNRGELQVQDFLKYDLFYFLRPYMPIHTHLIQELNRYRRRFHTNQPLVLDFDDDNKNLPRHHLNYADEGENYPMTKMAMEHADFIWFSTQPIFESYSKDNSAFGAVIPNAAHQLDIQHATFNPVDFRGVRIWWGGSAGHHHDVFAWEQQYYKLQKQASKFYWVGYVPPFNHDLSKAVFVDRVVPTLLYWDMVKQEKPHYIYKPMERCKFNDAKSNIAYITATLNGALCLTNYAGSPGWKHAVKDLVIDKDKPFEIWKNALDDIRENYNLEAANRLRWSSIYNLF